MPVDAVEFERRRRKQGGMCSIKSLVCCLTVLVGQPSLRKSSKKKQSQQPVEFVRTFEDDDSFGYNFDEQMSPRVMTRLAGAGRSID